MRTIGILAGLMLLPASGSLAQEQITACETQQALEQVIRSDGQLKPEGCRPLAITPVEVDAGRLCVLDFSGGDPGILQRLRDAALPEKWWVRCDELNRG
ncbi:hypothetical protein [Rhodoligotrophos defluvii]|uniref:hypothetical protein n=1 Tax=Rhodoligotrophos defluvii TaxID=2561934 RepID=UPI0010C95721|nr:hypothetical protein [Rhodoligotrophos defluvii]